MNDEADQLRRYAATGSEDAFAALVQRHIPLVYQAARRRLGGDAHAAQDVAQAVFVALARNAKSLVSHPDLTGWLFVTTRFLAAKTIRTEKRRRIREETASREEEIMRDRAPEGVEAGALPAVLDDVLMELRQLDRQMILLRFHRGLRMAEIGVQLGLSENAAQKRIDRALERLRDKLAHRGITSTAIALSAAFAQQTAVAVPTGLAAAVTTAGISGGIGAGALFTAASFMAVSKLQLSLAAAALMAATSGVLWEVQKGAKLRAALAGQTMATDAAIAGLRQQVTALQQRATAAENDVTQLERALRTARAAAPAGRILDGRTRTMEAINQANALQRERKYQEALAVLMSCYRELVAEREMVERQLLMSSLVSLGRVYPSAMDSLRELRDEAFVRLKENPDARAIVSEIGLLNDRLKDSAANLALYDSLPPTHPGRQGLALTSFAALVEARRYQEAFMGKSFGAMLNELELRGRSANQPIAGGKAALLAPVVANIEVLIGLGRNEEAESLIQKLLALDDSEATQAAIQRHTERGRQNASP